MTVIFQRDTPAYPLFLFAAILPWKWFNTVDHVGISSVVGQERLIKQIKFPKLVLPVAAVIAGIVNFFFGLIPLAVLILAFYPTPVFVPATADKAAHFVGGIHAVPADPGHRLRPAPLHAGGRDRPRRRSTSSSATSATCRATSSGCGSTCRPALYAIDLTYKAAENHPILAPIILANPWNILFTSYRDVIYEGRAPDWVGLGILSLVSIGLLGLAIYIFKRLEPTFAKVL